MSNNALTFNKSDYSLMSIYLLIASIWLAFKFFFLGSSLLEGIIDISKFCLQILIALFFFRWIIESYILKKQKYVQLIIFSLLFLIVLGCTTFLIGVFSGGEDISHAVFPLDKFIITGFATSAPDIAIPLALIFGKKYLEDRLTSLKLVNEQKENKLRELRSQFDPHFLFNSLNTVDALIDDEPQKAKNYLSKLASIYRHLVSSKDEDIIPLSDEITFIKNYIYLIEIRFDKDYKFNLKINSELQNKYVPHNALQIVLENVVKHNKALDHQTVNICISINESNIIISNNKTNNTYKSNESLGSGLKNLIERYQLLMNKTIVINDSSKNFEVILPLIKTE